MKELQSMLQVDIDEIELAKVTEIERKRVKNFVLGTRKKKYSVLKKVVAAALILVGSTVTVGFTFPTLASQLPFMQNIINHFTDKESIYSNFSENATTIGQMQSSNGISIMIENAVFDGTSLTVTYAIETEEKLGEKIFSNDVFNIKGASGAGFSSKIEKIDDATYVGIANVTPIFNEGKTIDTMDVTWAPKSFTTSGTQIKGDWQFHFTVDKLVGNTQFVDQSTHLDGVTLLIQSIDKTDVSTVIHYKQFADEDVRKKWAHVSATLAITDNLGHRYEVQGNGGFGAADSSSFEGSNTMKAIDPQATSLTIISTIYLHSSDGDMQEKKEMAPIVVELQ
ncbi:DUF4179 domain-containing protein [Lysinibacillus fusiformis]|nr:DUF4179 domain-containing protein [Lysinibacillus fusiformis]